MVRKSGRRNTCPLARDRVLVQMRFKRDLHNQVKAAAALEDLPVSQWIRRLCIAAIGRPAQAPTNSA
jgi:hypothetical protein